MRVTLLTAAAVLAAGGVAAPIPAANADASPILAKPIQKIHYCYADGRCFPEDYKKTKREAEAYAMLAKPIKKISYCYGDAGPCVEGVMAEAFESKKRDAAPEPEPEPAKPIKKIQYCYGDAGSCVEGKKREAAPKPPVKPDCPRGQTDCPPPWDPIKRNAFIEERDPAPKPPSKPCHGDDCPPPDDPIKRDTVYVVQRDALPEPEAETGAEPAAEPTPPTLPCDWEDEGCKGLAGRKREALHPSTGPTVLCEGDDDCKMLAVAKREAWRCTIDEKC